MIVNPAKRLDQISTYYFALKMAEIESMNKDGGPIVLNLGIGSPDLLPPKSVLDSMQHNLNLSDAHKYQPYKGIYELRKAFVDWYQRYFYVKIDPDTEILPLMGSKEGILHISMAYLDPGDEVLVPNPGYPSYSTCTLLAGGIPIDMPLVKELGWKPDLAALEKRDLSKVKLMWINYPNMPTGAIVDQLFFEELVRFAQKHNILICHDNPYALILNEKPVSIFNAMGAVNCAIELVSLSKCYNMAGWRVGAVVAAKEYIDTILTFKSNMDSGMFKPVQLAAIEALNSPYEWIENLNFVYLNRKKIACDIMDLLNLDYDINGAGLFVWGKIKDSNLDAESFSNQLLQLTRVFISPGHIFGTLGSQYLRISLCSSEDDMKAALYRIKTGMNLG